METLLLSYQYFVGSPFFLVWRKKAFVYTPQFNRYFSDFKVTVLPCTTVTYPLMDVTRNYVLPTGYILRVIHMLIGTRNFCICGNRKGDRAGPPRANSAKTPDKEVKESGAAGLKDAENFPGIYTNARSDLMLSYL